ncbi:Hypothetical protein PHPALM_14173 [Phytophthora palmivora]|uniref:SWIM-type domain-containing protein n=1 Tax=Phytophthora palmivora TaxID=4796 RepID=A0A2P4XVH4_9STRA|nr:Hypothetical protein PHPALM_14173 [Phytophthora palmivora]
MGENEGVEEILRIFFLGLCFHTPCGFATTNNPCETFNAATKRDATMHRKLKIGALIPQLLTLCESESMMARPFATACAPNAKLVRRVRAMSRANLLSLRVLLDETRRRLLEDLPVSAQLNKLTANMETAGMPTLGWAISMKDESCPCNFWIKYGSCIHVLYAKTIRGTNDAKGRETLVNRSASTRKGATTRTGRPKKNGHALDIE